MVKIYTPNAQFRDKVAPRENAKSISFITQKVHGKTRQLAEKSAAFLYFSRIKMPLPFSMWNLTFEKPAVLAYFSQCSLFPN